MNKNYLKICLLVFMTMILILESYGLKAYASSANFMQSESLSVVLNEISDSYNVYFSYDSKTVEKVSVDFTFGENEEIDELMGRLLSPTDLNHKIYGDKYYVIVENTRKGKRQARKLKKQFEKIGKIEKIQYINSLGSNYIKSPPPIERIEEEEDNTVYGPIVSGTVISSYDDQPLVGVNILIKGTSLGTITDLDGRYEIELPDDEATLVFSYTGFITMEVVTAGRATIDITLSENAEALDEFVVIGYGSVKKSDVTGAVASIKDDELTKIASVRVDDALRGKVSGLQITPTSSAPGAGSTIRIRGSNSISANNEPLYVIDGFIGGGDLNSINVNDIKSIEVLKDASATALYGSRGSNGVILITTKRGENGKTKLNFDSYVGFQTATKLFDMLNASEYASWINEIQGSAIYPNPTSYGEGTDWQKEIFQENAAMSSHTLSVSGGNEKTKYFLSGNYFDQDAIYLGGNLKRYQLRLNADHQINDMVRIGNSLTISRTINNPRNSNIINTAGWTPILPVVDDNGAYTFQTFSSEFNGDNPVAITNSIINNQTRNNLLGNVYGEVEPIEGLIYKISLGSSLQSGRNQNYSPSTLFSQRGFNGTASVGNFENLDLLVENTLNYTKEFGDHSLNALVGYTRQRIFQTESFVSVRDFVADAFTFNNLGAGVDRNASTSGASEIGFESYLFRAQYSWRSKFLFTVSARSDASSVFAANNKRALFPSGAFAWRLIQEDFIND
ncbi:MAG: TonB-linked SusC/RagA family outer membrane protein, partial [Saprospiraceae bacterium]